MRCRTALILSVGIIGGMFIYPSVILAIFLPALKQGQPNPVPAYERLLLDTALFCEAWRFVTALPIVAVLFTIAGITHMRPPRRIQ